MIVPMSSVHVPQIAQLERECFSDPWSQASIGAELENPLSFWLVDEEDGAVTGYVGSQSVPPESDLMNLAVAPAYRRQGRAAALMKALMRALAGQGMESLTLEVRVSNLPARTLYAALGFAEVGRRPNYYVKPVEDALILRKELHDADTFD